jgi:hypothetical protein
VTRRYSISRGAEKSRPPVVREAAGNLGVCALCGCDTELLKRILDHASSSAAWFNTARHTGDRRFVGLYWVRRDELLRSLGFVASGWLSETDACGRVLCTPCHKVRSAELEPEPVEARLFDDLAAPASGGEQRPVERRRVSPERVTAPPRPSEYERRLAEIRARAAGLAVRERRFTKRGSYR